MLSCEGPDFVLQQYGRGAAQSKPAIYYQILTAVHSSPPMPTHSFAVKVLDLQGGRFLGTLSLSWPDPPDPVAGSYGASLEAADVRRQYR
jgi:hypothetical protein